MEEITQDTATLALMMDREIDKRVMLALHRALFPLSSWREKEIERAYDQNDLDAIQRIVRSMVIEVVMQDGSLVHMVKSKIVESLNRAL